jgi:predicted transcriptional regulator
VNADERGALGVTNIQELNTLRFDVDRLVAREEARHEHRVKEEELRVELRQSDDVWRDRTSKTVDRISQRVDRVQETTEKLRDQIEALPNRIDVQLQESREAQAAILSQAAKHAAEAVAIAAKLAAKEQSEKVSSTAVRKVLTRGTQWIISAVTAAAVIIVGFNEYSMQRPGDDRTGVIVALIVGAIAVLTFVWIPRDKYPTP